MRRRTKFALAALVAVAIIAGAGYAAMRIAQNWVSGAIQEAMGIGAQEMSRLGENASDPKSPPVETRQSATLDGDTTTLTIRHQNHTRAMVIDLAVEKAVLGKLGPKDKLDFPIRIGQLAPGATHELALHYENVPWKLVGDDSAEVSLAYDENWTGVIKGVARKMKVRGVTVNVQMNDSNATHRSTTEGSVRLDAAGARELKRRREAGPKGGNR
jgi:hypothetical protein